jgi:hypothetical protein
MLNRTRPDCPDAFHDTPFVLDPEQSCVEAEQVQACLETWLERVDPASPCWDTREAHSRAAGATN